MVRLGPDGALYAATVPSGKVYKLNPGATAKQDDASATVVFDAANADSTDGTKQAGSTSENRETKSHYIWDMTFDSAGRLYIATGGPGAVYRVDPAKPGAKPEVFFKSDEQHIRAMAWDAKGNLIAGSDGSGLVYRIEPTGQRLCAVRSAAPGDHIGCVAANGTIYAASVGDKSHNPLPPLPVQGVGIGDHHDRAAGIAAGCEHQFVGARGHEIYALAEGQAPRKIWSGKDEIVYALAARPDGVLALTGNRGRIFRIQDDGSFADSPILKRSRV